MKLSHFRDRVIWKLKRTFDDFVAKAVSGVFPKRIAVNKRYFPLWEDRGYHVTPVHFCEPIPDTRTLKKDLWKRYSELPGLNMNEKRQLEILAVFASQFSSEYNRFPIKGTFPRSEFYVDNPWFGAVDAEIYYCMIRHFKPSRIIEIGSGYSTMLAAQAVKRNAIENDGYDCLLLAIEPHPGEVLKRGFPGLSQLVTERVQDVPISEFIKLNENDILFIDSSHVLKIGSDVQHEYLEILPRLKKGVIIHVHDIFLPAEYREDWVLQNYTFWNEQYLLQAFLVFNETFETIWAGHYMHLFHPDKLEKAFPSYKKGKVLPQSFWMQKVE